VILSQTLQQVFDPQLVIEEMLRIGRRGIVSFPCFNHIKIKLQLLLKSRAPVTKELPYEWYNTPNIRVITLKDFRTFCTLHKIRILKELDVNFKNSSYKGRHIKIIPDWFSRFGIFLLGKK
jgi:methionine biosynthesis protein MetW